MKKLQKIPSHPSGSQTLTISITPEQLGFVPEAVWNSSPGTANFTGRYPVPKTLRIGTSFDFPESASRFSPPVFAVAVYGGSLATMVVLRADRHYHLWSTAVFTVTDKMVEISVDLEGHTDPAAVMTHIDAVLVAGNGEEDEYALLNRALKMAYPYAYKPRSTPPAWWSRPLACGGGGQIGLAYHLEGPGPEPRMLPYCTQGLYERYLARFDEAQVPIGTVIIDVGWSPGGDWRPIHAQWPDLKGFIARQHDKGRRVLLWIATFFTEGLPDEWCIRLERERLLADPTHPEYRKFIRKQVHYLLSPEGLDADGFKIDQLQVTPSERHAIGCEQWNYPIREFPSPHAKQRLYGKLWGCELLYLLQKTIYDAAKKAKPDALINSSTAHPYFHDTFDMLRLHDTGMIDKDTDVFAVMASRARLVRAILPFHLIDADNWVHSFYEKWVDYTQKSWQLGVPCIFFNEYFILNFDRNPTTCPVKIEDLQKIGQVWRNNRIDL